MRVFFHTFGCKANQYDTERMRQESEARGARAVADWSDAQVCVLNTCTVTNQADADARRMVRRIRRDNPNARVVVAGCSAALRAAEYERMDGVAVVAGHDPHAVAAAVAPRLIQLEPSRADRLGDPHAEPIGGELLRARAHATRGWLKIQDGCDRQCSFCATRLARGASRSRAADTVLAEARLLARVHPELVLTGIHIGHWGLDLAPPSTLASLLELLVDHVPGVRFRLGSVEATEIDDALLDLIAGSSGRVAPHLHMPLQSGADPVLRRMRRWHTGEAYRRRALDIAERVPTLGLGADVITGFPGETDADHAATRALVAELPFTYLHVFPFSPRDGTAASALHAADPVPQRVAGERALELRELAERKGAAHRAARVGQRAEVAVEAGGQALTGDYLRVRAEGGSGGPGSSLQWGVLRSGGGDPHADLYIDLTRSSAPI